MINYLTTKLKEFWARRKMTPYEYYLSQSVDLADLENRMKHGYNRDFAPFYDEVRTRNLFLVRGF